MNYIPRRCLAAMVSFGLISAFAIAQGTPQVRADFEYSLRRFGADHDRVLLRQACERELTAEPNYPLAVFYLGVIDEADENWTAAEADFRRFLILEEDSDLSTKARAELKKLSEVIRKDSTPSGKLNRRYSQLLSVAQLLQKRGFAKEALLEVGEAAKLDPARWEAYAFASSIMASQGDMGEANHFLDLARTRAPASASEKLSRLSDAIRRK